MPSLGWKLSDSQVADILTYVRNNWGNRAPAVSTETVGRIRGELHSGS
jgi:mono/diheme cytochrome c family protein